MSHFKKIIRKDAKGTANLKDEVRKFLKKLPKVDDTGIYNGT